MNNFTYDLTTTLAKLGAFNDVKKEFCEVYNKDFSVIDNAADPIYLDLLMLSKQLFTNKTKIESVDAVDFTKKVDELSVFLTSKVDILVYDHDEQEDLASEGIRITLSQLKKLAKELRSLHKVPDSIEMTEAQAVELRSRYGLPELEDMKYY